MEECCVVCAEPLEWVGYGVCGHRDVCSTCIARLRFVLKDKCCCICKQESTSVVMTKALGDYTKVIKDFQGLQVCGDFWYDNNTQAYFDDKDHYTMIKAMCRLSCQICEQAEGMINSEDFVKKGHIFNSLDLLVRHVTNAHKVQMCSLCLEGRKAFICEQKLYSKLQLERHLATGDCEIDGIGDERGGFTGHPMCNFCQRRYYGGNELYHHMSVDHYLCHICQRLNPGQYDYFNSYGDLEAHFRNDHSLCEHPDCLAKKFVVFTSEVELKRHNALTHGGNMSRAQRTAALQIPVRVQYRGARNQGHASSSGNLNGCLSTGAHGQNQSNPVGFAAAGYVGDDVNIPESIDQTTQSLSRSERSGYVTAAGGTSQSSLEDSAFPPLPGSKTAKRKTKQRNRGPVISAGGLRGGNESRGTSTPSSLSHLHGRVEDQSGRSSIRTVSMPNQWQQIPGRDICSEGGVNVLHVGNRRNFFEDGVRGKVPDSESPSPIVGGSDYSFKVTDELRNANKALSDCVRARLGNNENIFMAFRDLSAEFRKGELDAHHYCKHIQSLGLWDLVPELARLCPDPERQKNLMNVYKADSEREQPIALTEGHHQLERKFNNDRGGGRGKDAKKVEASELTSVCSTMDAALTLTADRGGTSSGRDSDRALSRDNHHKLKGKQRAESSTSQVAPRLESSSGIGAHNKPGSWLANGQVLENVSGQSTSTTPTVTKMWSCSVCTLENRDFDCACAACGTNRPQISGPDAAAHGKRMKKISKFEKLRLDKDVAPQLRPQLMPVNPQVRDPSQKARTGGAWGNGGGQRLVALAQRDAVIEDAWRRST